MSPRLELAPQCERLLAQTLADTTLAMSALTSMLKRGGLQGFLFQVGVFLALLTLVLLYIVLTRGGDGHLPFQYEGFE